MKKLKKIKCFCFETTWIKHAKFLPKIREIWDRQVIAKDAVEKWCIKINKMNFLKGWHLNLKGQTKRYKRLLQDEFLKLEKLEEEGLLPRNLQDRKTFIQTELLKILEEEEIYWHKHSNSNWLLKGDSTDFFHKVANGHKRKILFLAYNLIGGTLKGMRIF